MADDASSLDELRAAIDRMDAEIHDLLMARISLTDRIAAVKNRNTPGVAKMRPGREAHIMRKLMGRHQGPLSPRVVARIWREIMSAVVYMQEPFSVMVAESGDPVVYWDLARFHFGTQPHELVASPLEVIAACRAGGGIVGVLPAPSDGEAEPWWVHLTGDVRVFGRLPFLGGARNGVTAYTVGQVPLEESGDDLTWIVLETREEVSRGRIADWLKAAGLPGRTLASHNQKNPAIPSYLIELAGFFASSAPDIAALKTAGGKAVAGISVIGAFARPIALEET